MRETQAAEKRLAAANARAMRICPQCGRDMARPGYGTGSTADGDFCSLGCLADFWYGSQEGDYPVPDRRTE